MLLLNKPLLSVSTDSINFGTRETENEFTITNTALSKWFLILGLKPLDYKIGVTKGKDWISVTPGSGTSEGEINAYNGKNKARVNY